MLSKLLRVIKLSFELVSYQCLKRILIWYCNGRLDATWYVAMLPNVFPVTVFNFYYYYYYCQNSKHLPTSQMTKINFRWHYTLALESIFRVQKLLEELMALLEDKRDSQVEPYWGRLATTLAACGLGGHTLSLLLFCLSPYVFHKVSHLVTTNAPHLTQFSASPCTGPESTELSHYGLKLLKLWAKVILFSSTCPDILWQQWESDWHT